MNCIVTAGPTYESLDKVRRLTNFSTGKLGTELANWLVSLGHRVFLLRGYYAVYRGMDKADEVVTFTTTADLSAHLQVLAKADVGAVFHAAAVSDFGFGKVYRSTESGELEEEQAGKFATGRGRLLVELVPTPKIISQLRGWFASAWLVGWKYEVDGEKPSAVNAGIAQIQRCRTDACVVNGPAYGDGFALVNAKADCQHVPNADGLFELLGTELSRRSSRGPK